MKKLAEKVLADLGLPSNSELVSVTRVPPPKHFVAQGLAVVPAPEAGMSLAQILSASAIYSQVHLEQLGERVPDAQVKRWDRDPRVVIVEGSFDPLPALSGTYEWLDPGSSLALDSRQAPVFLRWKGRSAEWIIGCEKGEIELLEPSRSAAFHALATSPSAPLPEVPVPDLRSMLGGCKAESWLLGTTERMAQASSPLCRIAAVGLLARLWFPETSEELSAATEQVLSEQGGPAESAACWFLGLDAALRREVEHSAVDEAEELGQQLPELQSSALADPEAATRQCLQWLHGRDDLKSVLFLCQRTNAGESLHEKLEELDRHASTFKALWSWLDVTDDERLRAVSWQEPDAWWGQLAVA